MLKLAFFMSDSKVYLLLFDAWRLWGSSSALTDDVLDYSLTLSSLRQQDYRKIKLWQLSAALNTGNTTQTHQLWTAVHSELIFTHSHTKHWMLQSAFISIGSYSGVHNYLKINMYLMCTVVFKVYFGVYTNFRVIELRLLHSVTSCFKASLSPHSAHISLGKVKHHVVLVNIVTYVPDQACGNT